MAITVTAARAEDLPEAASVLADAFEEDPVLRAVIQGERDRRDRLRTLFQATLSTGAFAHGTVDLARDPDLPGILGVAAWEGPQGAGGVRSMLGHTPDLVRAIGLANLPRAISVLSVLGRRRPRSPHWYLAEIGVASRARGRGVGGILLNAQLRAVDAMRLGAYLESSTSRNRRLYERAGFASWGPIEGIPGTQPEAMFRPPGAGLVPTP